MVNFDVLRNNICYGSYIRVLWRAILALLKLSWKIYHKLDYLGISDAQLSHAVACRYSSNAFDMVSNWNYYLTQFLSLTLSAWQSLTLCQFYSLPRHIKISATWIVWPNTGHSFHWSLPGSITSGLVSVLTKSLHKSSIPIDYSSCV